MMKKTQEAQVSSPPLPVRATTAPRALQKTQPWKGLKSQGTGTEDGREASRDRDDLRMNNELMANKNV